MSDFDYFQTTFRIEYLNLAYTCITTTNKICMPREYIAIFKVFPSEEQL